MPDSNEGASWMNDLTKFPAIEPGSLFSDRSQYNTEPYVPDLPEVKTYFHQLVVLGNGFDLQCGLKSKFSDYYASCKQEKIDALMSHSPMDQLIIDNANSDDRFTIWDLILSRHASSNWCDIEQTIAEWITDDSMITNTSTIDINRYVNKICGKYIDGQGDARPFFSRGEMCDAIEQHINATFSEKRIQNCSKKVFLEYLMDELHMLEHQFNEYLQEEISAADYKSTSAKLLRAILEDGLILDEEDEEITHSILDFNYTVPSLEQSEPLGDVSISNVHGRLENEIIFGIDGKDCMNVPQIAPFTKTYRLLLMRRKPLDKLIDVPSGAPLDGGTSIIKFYGHSLGEADYSYFQAIFDALDIYSGSTELIFYYNPDAEERHKKADAVTNLMNTYGETFDNHDHGKNLIHKLLLEGRLIVKPLPMPVT